MLKPVQIGPEEDMANWVFICKEYEKTEFDVLEIINDYGITLKEIYDGIDELFKDEKLKDQTLDGNIEEKEQKALGKMGIENISDKEYMTVDGKQIPCLAIKAEATSGWLALNFEQYNLRLTIFITPKFIKCEDINNEEQYHDLALRFIKTVNYSTNHNQRTFFSKNLSKLCDFIPRKLLVPYYIKLLDELFYSGPGLAREYVTKYKEESIVRGRVNYSNYARNMFSKPHLLPQYQTELSIDSKYSQFLLHAAHKSIEVSELDSHINSLNVLLPLFSGVTHREIEGDYFEGVEIPPTLLDYKDCISIASMIISENIAVFDAASDLQIQSIHLLYSPEYIFEGLVNNILHDTFKNKGWECDDGTGKRVPWTRKVSDLSISEETGIEIGAQTDHVLMDNDGNAVMVFESKVTQEYSKKENKRINKTHAEQLIVSMITHQTLRGVITAPLPESDTNGPEFIKSQDMPWAEFPVTNLFGYQYRDGPNNEIKRPRIYLMYIDTEVVVDKNSPDYEDEKRRLRKMIENIRIKTSISGTINALPPLP